MWSRIGNEKNIGLTFGIGCLIVFVATLFIDGNLLKALGWTCAYGCICFIILGFATDPTHMTPSEKFSEKLYDFGLDPSKEKEMIDFIYDTLDEMILAKDFNSVDVILSELQLSLLSVPAMLALLTITLPYDVELRTRYDFYDDVKTHLIKKFGSPETEKLLKGLE